MKKYYLFLIVFNILSYITIGQVTNLCTTSPCPNINNLIINTAYNSITQTALSPGEKDTNWIVTLISADLQNAFCNGNTTAASPPPAGAPVSPVAVGQPSLAIQTFPVWPQFGNYVSCFPFNTPYTDPPAVSNYTNCIMDITRNFFICSNNNENVTFNLNIATDDYTRSVIIDEGTANPIILFAGATPYNVPLSINATENLSPGMHTLTVEGADYEDLNGQYFNLPSGATAQWNPFGICVTGSISSADNVFVNNSCTPLSLCTGSLGDPVVNITFGSGANPGQSLPAIVPGASTTLTYIPVYGDPATPTLEDGQYTITNNIPSRASNPWFSGAFDHTSGNGTGYMAFYNSSELPGEFYHQTVNNLCGSTTYQFAAWIANAVNPTFYAGENPNVTFTIEQTDGTILASYNTGDIPEASTFTWNQYGFYFTTPSSVSTVVLRMINNNSDVTSGLGGNDFAIDDITFRACGPTSTASFNQNLPVDTLKICADTSVTIYGTVSTGYNSPNYLWQVSVDSGKTWTDIPNSNALQIPVTSQANQNTKQYNYRLMTTEGNNINSPNCRVASNMTVLFVNALPQGKLTGNTICNGDNTTLIFTETSGSSPFNIIYNVGANIYNQSNLTNSATFPVPYQLTDTTTFNLFSITDANGCVDTINAATVVNVNPIPQGGITANTVCSGDSTIIVFTASSGNAPFEIQLSDGTNTTTYYGVQSGKSFNILPIYNTETIYLVSIIDQNGNGCSRTNGFTYPSALVTAIPSPQVQFDSVPPVCINQPSFIISEAKEITGSSGNGIFSGQGSDANGNFSPSLAGVGNHIITYTYKSINGCADSVSRDVVVNSLPVVNAGSDIITCIGFPVRLNVTGATTYSWLPVLGLDDPTRSNPVATLDTTTTFIVQGTDPTGCFAFDTVTVEVSTKGIAAFQVPNAFTPNGDGKNDCFGIRNWGSDITVEEFNIYNRWGQLIFSTKKPSDCWDGTFKGAKQNSGGYPYIIKATSPCGNITRTGIVLLIR